MPRRTYTIAAVLSLLSLGQPLLLVTLGITTAATAVFVQTQAAAAQDNSASQNYSKLVLKSAAMLKSKDWSGALSTCNKLIALAPQIANLYYCRGVAKFELKDFKGAINDLSKAIELDPKIPDFYFMRSLSKGIIGELKSGCSDLRIASSLGHSIDAFVERHQCR